MLYIFVPFCRNSDVQTQPAALIPLQHIFHHSLSMSLVVDILRLSLTIFFFGSRASFSHSYFHFTFIIFRHPFLLPFSLIDCVIRPFSPSFFSRLSFYPFILLAHLFSHYSLSIYTQCNAASCLGSGGSATVTAEKARNDITFGIVSCYFMFL